MKILFVNHFPLSGSGSGVYTANLAKSLTRKGHQTAIIFPENRASYEKYEGIRLYPVFFKNEEKIDGVNQLDMNFPCFTTHPRSILNFADMTEKQKKEYEDAFYNKIESVIEEFKPDVIHAQHLWTLAGISAKCCKEHNLPLVITCHGTDLMGISNEKNKGETWGTNWAQMAVDYSSKIVTISQDSKHMAEAIMPDTIGKTIWIRNGVDNHVFFMDKNIKKEEVLIDLGIKKEYKNVVSFVGKLTEFKGVDILLEAASLYEDEDTVTLIAGDGELREKLENNARQLNLQNVYFLGNLPQDKLNKIYNIANCSLVTSRREPFGLVAAEAMSCGAPVIATNQGGLPDFVTPDVGILFDVDDYKRLAKEVKAILNGNKVFDREKTADKMHKLYSQDSLIYEFEKIYEEAIK